jgi:hypothetical protein
MAQIRRFEWLAPDSTQQINLKSLMGAPQGLYEGANLVPTANMNLTLSPLKLVTQSGLQIEETANTVVPINITEASPRIDAILAQHTYISGLEGGSPAIYVVSQGVEPNSFTPAANQTLIGYLYLPAACTALNQSGVVWFKAPLPKMVTHYKRLPPDTDLNTIFQEGNYYVSLDALEAGDVNFPQEANGYLMVRRIGARAYLQQFITLDTQKVYFTRMYGVLAENQWDIWKYLVTGDMLPPIYNTFNQYAPKAQEDFVQLGSSGLWYMKDTIGFVHFRGSTTWPGGGGMNFGTLPVGYRPVTTQQFWVSVEQTNGTDIVMTVTTSGAVTTNHSGTPYSSGVYFDGITFYAGF